MADDDVCVDFTRDEVTGQVGLHVGAGKGAHVRVEGAHVEATEQGAKRLTLKVLLDKEYSELLGDNVEGNGGTAAPSGDADIPAQREHAA